MFRACSDYKKQVSIHLYKTRFSVKYFLNKFLALFSLRNRFSLLNEWAQVDAIICASNLLNQKIRVIFTLGYLQIDLFHFHRYISSAIISWGHLRRQVTNLVWLWWCCKLLILCLICLILPANYVCRLLGLRWWQTLLCTRKPSQHQIVVITGVNFQPFYNIKIILFLSLIMGFWWQTSLFNDSNLLQLINKLLNNITVNV